MADNFDFLLIWLFGVAPFILWSLVSTFSKPNCIFLLNIQLYFLNNFQAPSPKIQDPSSKIQAPNPKIQVPGCISLYYCEFRSTSICIDLYQSYQSYQSHQLGRVRDSLMFNKLRMLHFSTPDALYYIGSGFHFTNIYCGITEMG